jgi:hypothetical protein
MVKHVIGCEVEIIYPGHPDDQIFEPMGTQCARHYTHKAESGAKTDECSH